MIKNHEEPIRMLKSELEAKSYRSNNDEENKLRTEIEFENNRENDIANEYFKLCQIGSLRLEISASGNKQSEENTRVDFDENEQLGIIVKQQPYSSSSSDQELDSIPNTTRSPIPSNRPKASKKQREIE
jgi:hypothetical protein